jgi:hypothetical protein
MQQTQTVLNIRCSETLKGKLEREAKRRGVKFSELVRDKLEVNRMAAVVKRSRNRLVIDLI